MDASGAFTLAGGTGQRAGSPFYRRLVSVRSCTATPSQTLSLSARTRGRSGDHAARQRLSTGVEGVGCPDFALPTCQGPGRGQPVVSSSCPMGSAPPGVGRSPPRGSHGVCSGPAARAAGRCRSRQCDLQTPTPPPAVALSASSNVRAAAMPTSARPVRVSMTATARASVPGAAPRGRLRAGAPRARNERRRLRRGRCSRKRTTSAPRLSAPSSSLASSASHRSCTPCVPS